MASCNQLASSVSVSVSHDSLPRAQAQAEAEAQAADAFWQNAPRERCSSMLERGTKSNRQSVSQHPPLHTSRCDCDSVCQCAESPAKVEPAASTAEKNVNDELELGPETESEASLRSKRDLVWLKSLGFDAISQRLARGEEVPIGTIDTITFMSERQKDAVRRRVSTVNESIRKRKSLEPANVLKCEECTPKFRPSFDTLLGESLNSARRHSALGLMTPIGMQISDTDEESPARIVPRTRECTPEKRTYDAILKVKRASSKKEPKRRRSCKRPSRVADASFEELTPRTQHAPTGSCELPLSAKSPKPRRKTSASSVQRKVSAGSNQKVSRVLPIPRISITFESSVVSTDAPADVTPCATPEVNVNSSSVASSPLRETAEKTLSDATVQECVEISERLPELVQATVRCDSPKQPGSKLRRFLRRLFQPRRRREKDAVPCTAGQQSVQTTQTEEALNERNTQTPTNGQVQQSTEAPSDATGGYKCASPRRALTFSSRHSIAIAGCRNTQSQCSAMRLTYSQSATPRRSIASALRERLRMAKSVPMRRNSASSSDEDAYDLADVINTRWHGEFQGSETNFLPISPLAPSEDYVLLERTEPETNGGDGSTALPQYELIEHDCGITLMSDLRPGSKETLTQIEELRRFVLLELTGLFDEQEIRCKIALPDLYKHARWTTAFRKQKEHQNVFGVSLWSLLEADAAHMVRRASQHATSGTDALEGSGQARRHSLSEKQQSPAGSATASASTDSNSRQNRSKRRSEPDSAMRVEDGDASEATSNDAVSGANLSVPCFLRQLVAHLRSHCLLERGLFRIAAQAGRVRVLMQTIDEEFYRVDKRFVLSECLRGKPHDAADLLKKFLKHLHPPLLTRELIAAFRAVGRVRDVRTQVEALNMLTLLLPEPNRNALLLVLSLLDDVARNWAVNKMTLHNVATVFAPTILYDHRDSSSNSLNPQASVGHNIAASAVALGATPAFLATSRSISSNSLASITSGTPHRSASSASPAPPGVPADDGPQKHDRLNTLPAGARLCGSPLASSRLGAAAAQSAQNLAVSPAHLHAEQNAGTAPGPGVARSSSTSMHAPGESQLSLTSTDILVVKLLIYYHRLLAVVPTKFIMQLRAYLRLRFLVADMPPPPKVPDAKRLPCTIAQRLNAAFADLQAVELPAELQPQLDATSCSRSTSKLQLAPNTALSRAMSEQPEPSTTRPSSPECDASPAPFSHSHSQTYTSPTVRCTKADSFRSERLRSTKQHCAIGDLARTSRTGSTKEHASYLRDDVQPTKRLTAKRRRSFASRFWPFRSTRGSRRVHKRMARNSDAHCRQNVLQLADTDAQQAAAVAAGTSDQLVASLELERRRTGEVYPLIIRVHAPTLGLNRKMIDVSMKPKVRDIVERFFRSTTPRSRMHFLGLPKVTPVESAQKVTKDDSSLEDTDVRVPVLNNAGTCLPEDQTADGRHVTYLYEVGAGIGEMRLDPDANMWDVYLRNPLARWVIK